MNRAAVTPWVDALLGTDRAQRVRLKQSLMAAGVYLGLSAIVGLGVWWGVVAWQPALWLVGGVVGLSALFYAVIRSGFNQRHTSDPALTRLQCVGCVVASCAAYAITGPLRGAMLMALVMGQVFGVFALTSLQARRQAAISMVAIGVTMAACTYAWPLAYPWQEEVLHFLLVALMLHTVGRLSGLLSGIRNKLSHQRAQLEAALAQNRLLATQDELTGLSNRRHMGTLMMAERGRQSRSRAPMSMVLMDIDHFKRVNDQHGHQAGDQVLQIFADVISNALRGGDAIARWGGEEFLMMLPNTGADEALMCVERMRMLLAERRFDHIAPQLTVTFSAGIGVCQLEDKLDTIIERADRAMYRAKTTGRNRTVVA